ncbi:phosphatidylinositol 3,4,5-trisphosphate 3-phosphatase and protein-tyrosine-phosphatase PTEN2A-like isoform X1 [Ipomoea triloba]|uniref:phosphatidylinositol 3,4,5-trisphosphate 3-phosphatase and protein-tyrosine-phosphatase PTEN2A-like isoform X1 n=1 Tax=Ipomoea triloba TaxID=35885 RepID=UPI00125E3FCF|nr:phosphatidylinositol 3,4,5-trisphosphate 3-phosphatase and protein-tyrosine-phosphatase PTEN2A-like isoform X1 [Ipomoea triloba]XP_031117350.1 phosphatidylinositol 3,4,5-trisphosphate 3-phosphatase and protein-tyrosine-phosphatase PTEN2A-like isoform X1 [Ipomoea triloba]
MDSGTTNPSPPPSNRASEVEPSASESIVSEKDSPSDSMPSVLSTPLLPSWAKNLTAPQPVQQGQQNSETGSVSWPSLSRLASGFGLQFTSKASLMNESAGDNSANAQSSVIESLTKGLADSSMTAVKALQVKARHIVSQNKRRYQEGGFDLDMTYITENIIAMGFPAGDMSSGFFGYVEGFYRNHMEEVINFFETHHKGKYKVYNLCSERLYNASLFEGKVASFPFDDHNCPPIHLIKLFCQSAYSWLKEDIVNVVVVHCKAGKARTGLMICSLLLFLKFFPTAEECIDYYNQKRCVDSKGLILPSQIRYVKYFERILTHFNGEPPSGRRCMLRGFRLHKCPYWIRPSITISNHNGVLFTTKKHPKTKDLMPEDFWIRAPRKGIVVFALPGEPGLTELAGDFKIYFHDRHGDFYCWLNTSVMENRIILDGSQLDGFDKRKFPSPGFQVEIVMIDYDGTIPAKFKSEDASKKSDEMSGTNSSTDGTQANSDQCMGSGSRDQNDDVFSDSEGEESTKTSARSSSAAPSVGVIDSSTSEEQITQVTCQTEQLTIGGQEPTDLKTDTSSEIKIDADNRTASIPNLGSTDFKAIAADASVFSFGDDDEDYESE